MVPVSQPLHSRTAEGKDGLLSGEGEGMHPSLAAASGKRCASPQWSSSHTRHGAPNDDEVVE